ncbi:hypothetical protein MKW92_005124, partial [Papaver armeniacum]
MNGLVSESTEDAVVNAMNDELPRIQEQVYYGHINSHTDVLDHFLAENGYRRYNPQIIGEGKNQKKLKSLAASILGSDSVLNDISYLHSPGTVDDVKPVTHLLVVNLTSKKRINLLREGIHYLMGGSKRARLGALFTTADVAGSLTPLFVNVFRFTVAKFSYKKNVLEFLDQLCVLFERDNLFMVDFGSPLFVEKVIKLAKANNLPAEEFEASLSDVSKELVRSHLDKVSQFLYREMGLDFGATGVITNGRIMLPAHGSTFSRYDLDLLESVEFGQRIKHIMEAVEETKWDDMDPDMLTRYDLDNIVLENLGDTQTLQAVYELESLVLTGHCSEKDHEAPRGLQLILGTKSRAHLVDTLVMANLGYFQMKASPGVWYLQLAPGRSSDLYVLKEPEDGDEVLPFRKQITIDDLRGKLVHLEVVKKKGREHDQLLSSSDVANNLDERKGNSKSWNTNLLKWASGLIGGSEHEKRKGGSVERKDGRHGKTINIFSVASGH